ncbi:MAG: class II aldolase/adducin family protein, partial [Victivallales bacterium]|nr:class II aldolase/adducin family protein [Victivallales bacterium]
MKHLPERENVAYFMRRLYKQKLTTTLGGNISVRLPDGDVLITPSATDKGEMKGEEIGLVDINGEMPEEKFRPSIETEMHLRIYRQRTDVNAIVHAHPVTACAFAASDLRIDASLILEAAVVLGEIAYADFKQMGTKELAAEVSAATTNANCVIMRNHGALAVGENILEAFDRLEVLENAAQMTIMTLGPLKGSVVRVDSGQWTVGS